MGKKDAARQKASLAFLKAQMKKAEKEANDKFGKAYAKLAADKAHFDRKLGAATNKLNMALAKQAALADGRFSKTVKDLAAARKQATAQVKQLRQDFAVGLNGVTAEAKRARGKLKLLMDENKAAASAEVKALEKSLNVKLAKARARNARNARQMKSDLRRATKKLYSKMAA